MRLIAAQEFKYAHVTRKAGEAFDAPDEDARLLIGWGKAHAAAASNSEGGSGLFQTKEQTAEKDSQSQSPPGRRQYRRRDMVSEG